MIQLIMTQNFTNNEDNNESENGVENGIEYDIESDSESERDYDSDYYEDVVYNYDTISATKYNIILCELYNDKIHGKTNNYVNKHYLLINKIKKLDTDFINSMTKTLNKDYIERQQQILPHKFIKNYQNMVTSPNYIKPEIGQVINLESGHSVCIIKTMWLKVIQRTWKKVYKTRTQIIKRRCCFQSLKCREITGYWPDSCRYLPSLQGMLRLRY